VAVSYKGHELAHHELDLIVESCVIVEIKAVSQLEEIHAAQLVAYLKATGLRAGLLMNFNKPVLRAGLRRIVL
jgi:GxxExxY protein